MMEFIYGLKLRMKQTLISLFISTFLLMGCSKQEEQKQIEKSNNAEISIASNPVSNSSTSQVAAMTPEQAHEFIQKLYKKIENDQKFLEYSFKQHDKKAVADYVANDWNKYAYTPYSEKEAKQTGASYFPDDDTIAPYLTCDATFSDLLFYANSISLLLTENNPNSHRIYTESKGNLERSKQKCLRLLKMPYSKVEEEYENN